MWALTRLRQFNRALHSSDGSWNEADAVAGMQFAEGLVFSCLLVTPFWLTVAIFVVHYLAK